MRVEIVPAGTDPTSRRYQSQHRGGSGIIEENKWLLLAIVAFIVITAFKYGGNLFEKSQPATSPTPTAIATPPPTPTLPSILGCTGWPADGEIIQDGRYHEHGIYVLDFSDEGMVSLLGECREDGTWNVFEPESASHK